MTPNFCLIAIYSSFWNLAQQGLTLIDIQKSIRLPASWLVSSLDLLIEKNYIRYSDSERGRDYFPTIPPEKLSLSKIRSDFFQKNEEITHLWAGHIDQELAAKAKLILEEANPSIMLSTIL